MGMLWSLSSPDPGQNLGMNKLSAIVSSSVTIEFCEYSVRKIDRRQLLQKDTHTMITRNGRKLKGEVLPQAYLQISYREELGSQSRISK
jgi:hypothetical protein